VWQDVRAFIQNPSGVLERACAGARGRELEGGERAEAQERRLAAKHSEREHAMRLYTRRLAAEEWAEVLLADLRNQADNLRLLISATEGDLSAADEDRLMARNSEDRMLTPA
jgi:hypothetical protein